MTSVEYGDTYSNDIPVSRFFGINSRPIDVTLEPQEAAECQSAPFMPEHQTRSRPEENRLLNRSASGGNSPDDGAITPVMSISPSSLPSATLGSNYSQTISGSGGTAPYTYSVTTGALPAGLTLDTSTSVLSGTPTKGGSFSSTVNATDSASNSAAQSYSLTVSAPTITVSPETLPGATQNSSYSQSITASGGTSGYTYQVTCGILPSGISLNSSTGVLSGTPTLYGNYSFTVTATDSSAGTGPYTGSASYTLSITASTPTITTSSLPNGTVGVSYSQTVSASDGNMPYTFSISSGSLPPGLSLSSGGVISGTPMAGGSYAFTVAVTDAASNTATQSYSIGISEDKPVVITNEPVIRPAQPGRSFSQTLTATGGTGHYMWKILAGKLPSGLSLDKKTGVISGKTGSTKPEILTLQSLDSNGVTVTKQVVVDAMPTSAREIV